MAKFMIQAAYTTDGVKGLMKDGGSKRRAAVESAVKGLGGHVESMYFAFGKTDAFIVIDGLDHISAAAVALTVASTGAVHLNTTLVMTPEEIDQACKKTVPYHAPGK